MAGTLLGAPDSPQRAQRCDRLRHCDFEGHDSGSGIGVYGPSFGDYGLESKKGLRHGSVGCWEDMGLPGQFMVHGLWTMVWSLEKVSRTSGV